MRDVGMLRLSRSTNLDTWDLVGQMGGMAAAIRIDMVSWAWMI